MRGKWIERSLPHPECHRIPVFPREREVDWKIFLRRMMFNGTVFPREREVDWKTLDPCADDSNHVFPREREVDWKANKTSMYLSLLGLPSWEGSGLKEMLSCRNLPSGQSSLVRGKWIESTTLRQFSAGIVSLPSWEGSGLKGTWKGESLWHSIVFPREREVYWKRKQPETS